MINDLWYKNAIIYCLSVGTYMDANGGRRLAALDRCPGRINRGARGLTGLTTFSAVNVGGIPPQHWALG